MTNLTNIFGQWTLPPERSFGWKMKPLESAKTSFIIDHNNVFKLTIEHDLIYGVSPKMLLWWFQNIGGNMTYQGKIYPKYLVWHPKDHIHWSLVKQKTIGTIGEGSYFRIVEAFGGNMKYLIDSTEYVEKLDETGIRLVKKVGSTDIFSLSHSFKSSGNNTIYNSEMIVGSDNKFFGGLFNSFVRPFIFSEEMGRAWLKHNIEEVGNFQYFLPELYEEEKGTLVKQ